MILGAPGQHQSWATLAAQQGSIYQLTGAKMNRVLMVSGIRTLKSVRTSLSVVRSPTEGRYHLEIRGNGQQGYAHPLQ